jgi:hypothetical protein
MRLIAFVAMVVWLAGDPAVAQTTTNAPPDTATNHTPALTNAAVEKAWSFSASASTYIVPDSREYVQPTLTADRGWLHLEARYNYESLDTGSAWIGYNFSIGEKLALEITPMLGGVFGDTTGIAPGYKFSLSYWKLDLYSEGEYVFDLEDSSGNFFYSWSELTFSPTDWLRLGLVAQRTRVYETDLDIQRGLLLGLSYKTVDFTSYVLNLGWEDPTLVFSVGVGF